MASKTTKIGDKDILTPLEKSVNELLITKIGGLSLEDLQKVAAAMMGRLMHEQNCDASLDVLGNLIEELQNIIVANKERSL